MRNDKEDYDIEEAYILDAIDHHIDVVKQLKMRLRLHHAKKLIDVLTEKGELHGEAPRLRCLEDSNT